jgi:hypothetical protein
MSRVTLPRLACDCALVIKESSTLILERDILLLAIFLLRFKLSDLNAACLHYLLHHDCATVEYVAMKNQISILAIPIVMVSVIYFWHKHSTSVAESSANKPSQQSTQQIETKPVPVAPIITPTPINARKSSQSNQSHYFAKLEPELEKMTEAERSLVLAFARNKNTDLAAMFSVASLEVQSAYEANWMKQHGFPSLAEQKILESMSDSELQARTDQGDMLAAPFLAERKNRKSDFAARQSTLREARVKGSIAAIYEEIRYIELQRRVSGNQPGAQHTLNRLMLPLVLLLEMLGDQAALNVIHGNKSITDQEFRESYIDARGMFVSIQSERVRRGLPVLVIAPRWPYQ